MLDIKEKHPDGAYKTLRLQIDGLPGVLSIQAGGRLELVFVHRFSLSLPREYPQSLGKIYVVNETPLFHPRIVGTNSIACYTVNGEIDRVLVDIIYNILLRPETIKPPSEFPDADWGLDIQKMREYIKYGPSKIYSYLRSEWSKKQKFLAKPSGSPKAKVREM